MATDFKVILKNKIGIGYQAYPYSVKVSRSTIDFTVSYYDDADHSGTLKTRNVSVNMFDVYITPKK